MDRITAYMWLRDTVEPNTAPAVSQATIDAALDAARIVDAAGLAPIDTGYTETIDPWYAAGTLFEAKARKALLSNTGQVSSFTSEGSSFTLTPGLSAADLNQLAAEAFHKSTVGGAVSVIHLEPSGTLNPPRSFPWT